MAYALYPQLTKSVHSGLADERKWRYMQTYWEVYNFESGVVVHKYEVNLLLVQWDWATGRRRATCAANDRSCKTVFMQARVLLY